MDLQTLINGVASLSLLGFYFWLRGLDKRLETQYRATAIAFGAVDANFDKLREQINAD